MAYSWRLIAAGRGADRRRRRSNARVPPPAAADERLGFGQVHALAQRIARAQQREQMAGQRLDDGDLQRQAGIDHRGIEALALLQQRRGALGERVQAVAAKPDWLDSRASASTPMPCAASASSGI